MSKPFTVRSIRIEYSDGSAFVLDHVVWCQLDHSREVDVETGASGPIRTELRLAASNCLPDPLSKSWPRVDDAFGEWWRSNRDEMSSDAPRPSERSSFRAGVEWMRGRALRIASLEASVWGHGQDGECAALDIRKGIELVGGGLTS